MANNQKKLKAFVRYDGSGRVVASSLILRKNKPRVGRWLEIPQYLCCNGTSPSTTTTTTNGGGVTPTAFVARIAGGASEACGEVYGIIQVVYSASSTLGTGSYLYYDAALTQPVGGLLWVRPLSGNTVYTVSTGLITESQACTTTTTTTVAPASCPTLGRAANFSVLGASTVTNTGFTTISRNLGLYPGTSVTGFPPGIVNGTQNITNAAAQNAQIDAQAAFTAFNLLSPTSTLGADIGGTTILPGVYNFASSAAITGGLTLDGNGNNNSVFIFLIPSTFIPAVGSYINVLNGAQSGNVYWIVGSSATLNTSSNIKGNIIAQASVTLDNSASLVGRAFALTGAVTLSNTSIISTNCTTNPLA